MRLQPFVRPFLICSHQPRIPGHVGGEDGGETAGRGHGWGRPPGRKFGPVNCSTTRASRDAPDEPAIAAPTPRGTWVDQEAHKPYGYRDIRERSWTSGDRRKADAFSATSARSAVSIQLPVPFDPPRCQLPRAGLRRGL